MNFWEYLDRLGERRQRRPRRDIRALIAFAFLGGYYWMVYRFATAAIPEGNVDLIRDAMLTLGPPVGIIVGAMFRTDVRDEQTTENTGKLADLARDALQSSPGGDRPDVTLQPGQTAKAAE